MHIKKCILMLCIRSMLSEPELVITASKLVILIKNTHHRTIPRTHDHQRTLLLINSTGFLIIRQMTLKNWGVTDCSVLRTVHCTASYWTPFTTLLHNVPEKNLKIISLLVVFWFGQNLFPKAKKVYRLTSVVESQSIFRMMSCCVGGEV